MMPNHSIQGTSSDAVTTTPTPSQPGVHVSQLVFSDGSVFALGSQDVVVVVGPNNAGKSATLRAIRSKLENPTTASPVLKTVDIQKRGTVPEFRNWVYAWTKPNGDSTGFTGAGQFLTQNDIDFFWQGINNAPLGRLTRWMCHFLSADERLQICKPPENISLATDSPNHPIHYLQRDDALEMRLSAKFRKAFGLDLIVHRNGGKQVPLYVGERPTLAAGEDRISLSYIQRLELLPTLHTQGDGMRSFAGVLLATSVAKETILLIDEPEAFLHPPQARLLGSSLVQDRTHERQLFIATHSTDVLRGVLDANSPDVKVIRIRRNGNSNFVRLLDNAHVRELWSDPLLRYSNILDGLFHEGVVVCEADADCRFYAAVLDSTHAAQNSDSKKPDILFTHCGGKARLPVVIRSLRAVDVPVQAIADFDVLADEQPLRGIVEALGGEWSLFEPDWRAVKTAVDAKRPDLNKADVKREIDQILGTISESIVSEKARSDLQSVLRRSTAWSQAKLVGKSFIPSGDPSKACERLLTSLQSIGLHVVEVGELEGFVRTEGGHGPKWVNAVLTRSLATDPELEEARRFSMRLLR